MLLTDEIGGEVYSVGEVRLHKPVITVRELIGVRVDLELEAHRDTRRPMFATGCCRTYRAANCNSTARKGIASEHVSARAAAERLPARDRMIEAAEQGFLRNRFFILLDDRQAEHLDDELELDKTGNVTFLQLTPLQGG